MIVNIDSGIPMLKTIISAHELKNWPQAAL